MKVLLVHPSPLMYSECHFRPKVILRISKEAMFNGFECRHLCKDANLFLKLRLERAKQSSQPEMARG
jgi:hypothetical protein